MALGSEVPAEKDVIRRQPTHGSWEEAGEGRGEGSAGAAVGGAPVLQVCVVFPLAVAGACEPVVDEVRYSHAATCMA